MTTQVAKWGNSLGVRLPKIFADSISLKDGCSVIVELEGNSILIRPAERSLKDMVSMVTPQNFHNETDWGEPIGKEIW
jgi:antitoxin MazE